MSTLEYDQELPDFRLSGGQERLAGQSCPNLEKTNGY